MSVYVSSWVWKHSTAKGNDLLVLLALADIADDHGICWPSVAHLATKTRLHEQTVRSRLKALRAEGHVEWEDRPGTSNRFRITMSTPTKSATPSDSLGGSNALTTPTNPVLEGGTNSLRRGTVIDTSDTSEGDVIELDLPKGTRDRRAFPNPFKLTTAMREWAAVHAPSLNVDVVTADFVAYWRVGNGAGKRMKNWELTWRRWLQREHTRNVERGWKPAVDDERKVIRGGRVVG